MLQCFFNRWVRLPVSVPKVKTNVKHCFIVWFQIQLLQVVFERLTEQSWTEKKSNYSQQQLIFIAQVFS